MLRMARPATTPLLLAGANTVRHLSQAPNVVSGKRFSIRPAIPIGVTGELRFRRVQVGRLFEAAGARSGLDRATLLEPQAEWPRSFLAPPTDHRARQRSPGQAPKPHSRRTPLQISRNRPPLSSNPAAQDSNPKRHRNRPGQRSILRPEQGHPYPASKPYAAKLPAR